MLKQITILSGKGGTGKTTLAASLAELADKIVLADCDVDAPDLHMLMKPEILEEEEFRSSKVAFIDEAECVECGRCEEFCRFEAVKKIGQGFKIDPVLCEGCGVCVYVCLSDAVRLIEQVNGHSYISKIENGFMSHALLDPGEENSGKLVSVVRQNAQNIAKKKNIGLILNDGSPGIGCPVIASIGGVDLGIVVAEPTLSGIHDMERALGVLNHFKVHPAVCVNKCDINADNTEKIESYCVEHNVDLIGKIPFDVAVREALVLGQTPIEHSPESRVCKEIFSIFEKIRVFLDQKENMREKYEI